MRTEAQSYITPPQRLIPLVTNPNQGREEMRDALLMLRGIRRAYISSRMTALFESIGNDQLVARRLCLYTDTDLHRPETELRARAIAQPVMAQTIEQAIAENNRLYTRYNLYYRSAWTLGIIGTVFWATGLGEMVHNNYVAAVGFYALMAIFYAVAYYCVRQHQLARSALSFRHSERAASMDRSDELLAQTAAYGF